ncbi:uncharacterized protein G2W53_011652 [Senna tora]|uniref:Uncharacterized protein n=1 Tax=Senna tora TaxID=362788 RepID=A0A834X245_9FABA|nr:uncharacterized protein G2W53_011652 [Senna tora]
MESTMQRKQHMLERQRMVHRSENGLVLEVKRPFAFQGPTSLPVGRHETMGSKDIRNQNAQEEGCA